MKINLFLIPFIIIVGLLLSRYDSDKNRKKYICFTILILMLECCLRSLSVGSDTPVYEWMYSNIQDYSWSDIWQIFVDRYVKRLGDTDIGYILLEKTISIFTESWRVFTFVAQLIFFVPLGVLLYRHTNQMVQLIFAFVFHVALIQVFPLSGARQLYAIGLTIAAFLYVENHRLKNAVLCMIFAATIHLSSLIFVFPLIMARFNAKTLKSLHLISFFFIPVVLALGPIIIQLMGSAVGMDRYANYGANELDGGGGFVFMFMIELLSLFCFIAIKKNDLDDNPVLLRLYTMLPLITLFALLIYVNGAMIRLSLYFHLYLMVLVPMAVELLFKKSDLRLVYFFIIVVLGVMCIRGGLVYHFYWQENQTLLEYVM